MPHRFEQPAEFEFDADPELVWDAISTGPGLSSWFMGATDVDLDARTVRTTMGDVALESAIEAYEPGRRFSFRGAESPDGRFFAMEFLVEARASGSTVLRMVSSGFLPGDDWEDEYEAMLAGGRIHRQTLVEYLTHFAGRPGVAVAAFAPVGDLDRRWAAMLVDLGVSGREAAGRRVVLSPAGLPAVDGVVDLADAANLGVRTDDAMYRFTRGFFAAGVGHHLFGADAATEAEAWRTWVGAVAR
ncbi:SRPBCC family protein [Agromyces sp. Marseille-Q5079]|uniref:SRPBCC family protein n=1 Tax=Agromyces sp. Marseille-Q5079 TaxID=3439059 RepID=UPI003D9C8114